MRTDQTLIILGASGDLTWRFLLPGLGRLLADEPDRRLQLIGSSRHDKDDWSDVVAERFEGHVSEAVDHTKQTTRWVTADVTKPEDLKRLFGGCDCAPVIYFAVGPDVALGACQALREVDIPAGTRLVLEKPFGHDADSADALNDLVISLVGQENVFRVDHFLATASVMGMTELRFGNPVLDSLWNRDHVDRVTVLWDEALGLAGRAGFYDKTGAVRDVIQSHLLQVLAATIMPQPEEGQHATDAMRVALDSLRPWQGPEPSARRARWTAGTIGGRPVGDYADDEGVDPKRGTETLGQLIWTSDLPAWQGVPLVVRTGKGLGANKRYVELVFAGDDAQQTNVLRLDIMLGSMELALQTSDPDLGVPVGLSLMGTPLPDHDPSNTSTKLYEGAEAAIYARVLHAALDNDQTLSVTTEAAVQSWRLVATALDAFAADDVPLEEYPAGSQGPQEWDDLPLTSR